MRIAENIVPNIQPPMPEPKNALGLLDSAHSLFMAAMFNPVKLNHTTKLHSLSRISMANRTDYLRPTDGGCNMQIHRNMSRLQK